MKKVLNKILGFDEVKCRPKVGDFFEQKILGFEKVLKNNAVVVRDYNWN